MEKGRQLLRSESGGGDEGGIYSVTTGQYVPTVKVVPHVLWQHYDHVIDEGRFAGRYAWRQTGKHKAGVISQDQAFKHKGREVRNETNWFGFSDINASVKVELHLL